MMQNLGYWKGKGWGLICVFAILVLSLSAFVPIHGQIIVTNSLDESTGQVDRGVSSLEKVRADWPRGKYIVMYRPDLSSYALDMPGFVSGDVLILLTQVRGKLIGKSFPLSPERRKGGMQKGKLGAFLVSLNAGTRKKKRPRRIRLPRTRKLMDGGFAFKESLGMFYYSTGIAIRASSAFRERFFTVVPKLASNTGEGLQRVNGRDIWANMHPAFHPSGKLLVFASNRPETEDPYENRVRGKIDLYYSFRNGEIWTVPKAFDTEINSIGNDVYPSFSSDGNLYFASDGRGGEGGMDLYKSELVFDWKNFALSWKTAQNLGPSVNSSYDDFALVWCGGKVQQGFFASTRSSAGADADIYALRVRGPRILVKVLAKKDSLPIPFVRVSVSQEKQDRLDLFTDELGISSFFGRFSKSYQFDFQVNGYQPKAVFGATFSLQQDEDMELVVYLEDALIPEMAVDSGFMAYETSGPAPSRGKDMLNLKVIGLKVPLSDDLAGGHAAIGNLDTIFLSKVDDSGTANYWIHFDGVAIPASIQRLLPGALVAPDTSFKNIGRENGEALFIFGKLMHYALSGGRDAPLSSLPMGRIDVKAYPKHGFEMPALVSGKYGEFGIEVEKKGPSDFVLFASYDGFKTARVNIADTVLYLDTMIVLVPFLSDTILIYHPFDKPNETSISRRELDRICHFVSANPHAKVKVESHTDSRGAAAYNLQLAKRRLRSMVEYICLKTGYGPEHFLPKAYGESQPRIRCSNCSEREHSFNRRTEVILINPNYAE
ncbi:MAG TPA: hypothetical protein ENJ82_10065 [Bacteroidetes bacterium]|nr:hypothetical protein [Bacteroidota bacterium]